MTLKAPITPTTNAEAVIRHLREENAELRRKLAQRDTENAALIVRLRQLEIDTQRALRKAERMANRSDKPSDQLAGASIPSERGEILTFPAPQEE
jgi:predicted RNase H-like nuclease (RuvC/YqgF family)